MKSILARLFEFFVVGLWRVLPMDVASGFGAFLVRFIALRYHRTTAATRKSLLCINPHYTPAELDRILVTMWQNIGRVWAEILISERLSRQRFTVHGMDYLTSAKTTGRPVIVPFLHTGNWEIVPPWLISNNLTPHVTAEIQHDFFNDLVNRVRRKNGLVVLKPNRAGTRKIYQCLKRGDTLVIALDEYKNGMVMGPSFGRNIQEPNNLDFALRLASKFSAVILPMYTCRLRGTHFELHISPPLQPELLDSKDGRGLVRQELEIWGESIIRAHVDQWYMLHRLRFQ